MSAQFFGRSGKVLYGAFSIVGMAYQSQNVNNGIPDDRVARSRVISIPRTFLICGNQGLTAIGGLVFGPVGFSRRNGYSPSYLSRQSG